MVRSSGTPCGKVSPAPTPAPARRSSTSSSRRSRRAGRGSRCATSSAVRGGPRPGASGRARAPTSRGLVALGVEPGDRVGLVARSRVEWVEADLGILRAGGVTVPAYPRCARTPSPRCSRTPAPGRRRGGPGRAREAAHVEVLRSLPEVTAVVVVDRAARLETPTRAAGSWSRSTTSSRRAAERPRVLSWGELAELVARALSRTERAHAPPRGAHAGLARDHRVHIRHDGRASRRDAHPRRVRVRDARRRVGAARERRGHPPLDAPARAHLRAPHRGARAAYGPRDAFARSPLTALDDCQVVRPTFMASVPRCSRRSTRPPCARSRTAAR